jgi:Domain of unknown function (DUF4203)
LIGIKNRWIQIFLSTAYLVSVSVLVLIDYVMHPPVSNAIQGGYFVAVFMTGCIFGGGALIFKEVTEGLGCLLGGFCLGMWFLTLKSGGIVSGSTGVGIWLAVFCIVGWGLSFSKYTRDYAIIGSTSFAGATAFTLGIDCFSRAGYKEFWLYVWNLNDNLFPLNTNTYPITRGIRVEIAVIVIGTLVGIISQLKLWKVIRERRKEKEATRLEEESRRDAVEETLGRHLQRQNEIAKHQWEKIYGHGAKRPMSMVDSVMDSDDQSKRGSRVSIISRRMHAGIGAHSQVVEMLPVNPKRSSANMKRQSTMSVSAIPEENEEHEHAPHNKSRGDVSATSVNSDLEAEAVVYKKSEDSAARSEPWLTEGPTYQNTATEVSSVGSAEQEPVKKAKKRRSFQGFLKRFSGHYSNPASGPQSPAEPSAQPNMSQEALVIPQMHHSRASSVAATLDEDHDKPDASRLSIFYNEGTKPPAIVVSPVLHPKDGERRGPSLDVPPSPPALSVEFDPEELTRPVAHGATLEVKKSESSLRSVSQRQSQIFERGAASNEQSAVEGSQSNLTAGALQAVPSQLSNVILSYRTNEWAKHITTADAPAFEEAQSIKGDAKDDLPTQVLSTVTGTKIEPQRPIEKVAENDTPPDSLPIIDRSLSAVSKPPKPHILPQLEDAVKSDRSGSLQKVDLKQSQSTGDLPRTSGLAISTNRGLRSSSTPMLGQSVVTSPIEENVETSFPPSGRVSTTPSPAGAAILSAQRQNLLRNQSMQRSKSQQDLLLRQSMIRSPSRTSIATADTSILNPLNSSGHTTPIAHSPITLGPIARPSTRLSTYDSRQPIRSSTAPTPQQRESMLAEWRTSMRQEIDVAEHPEQTMAQRRVEMLAQRAMLKRSESQQSYVQATREGAMDQLMRRGDMQEAHRTALRKMQERVNQRVM